MNDLIVVQKDETRTRLKAIVLEVAALTFGHLQQRDGRWCIVDLVESTSESAQSRCQLGSRSQSMRGPEPQT